MANYTFLRIGDANREIERLTSELTKAQAESKLAVENCNEVTTATEAIQASLKQASADLETAKASISSLTARAEKAETDLAAANAKIADPEAQIVEIASRKALTITQGQGQPPVTAGSQANAPGSGDARAEYAKITDSTERIAFYRKNKAAIDAAYSADRRTN